MTNTYSVNLELKVPPAVCPPEISRRGRGDIKLMIINRQLGTLEHRHLTALTDYIQPGDLLVVNDSQTIPAALFATVEGHPQRIHLAARLSPDRVIFELRTTAGEPDWRTLNPGDAIVLHDPQGRPLSLGQVLHQFHPKSRFWVASTNDDWYPLAQVSGQPIRYHYVNQPYSLDYYSTIFGRIPGSSEMPSASRPFTQDLVTRLKKKGVEIASLTLHTTVSSHEIGDQDDDLPLVPEWFHIPVRTRNAVIAARRAGRPIIALGTTVVRALETWAQEGRSHGWTTRLVTPENPPQLTSRLVTGMHDSFTSHLWLLYAFVDPAPLHKAYREAKERGYLWHEFGDLSFIY